MRVLFVDDEEMVLSGFRRAFFDRHWQMGFADSAQSALDYLAEQEVDFIISDMRMPHTDGATLLHNVAEQYPDVVRIVLSGQADETTAMKASAVAHQWIDKPCDHDVLAQLLERLECVRSQLPARHVREVIGRIKALPSPPQTYLKIRSLIDLDTSNIEDIAHIIGADSGLSAKVLQLTNSSFFLRGPPIDNIQDAVVRLGINLVASIVLLAESFAKMTEVPGISLQEEQEHALTVLRLALRLVPQEQAAVTTIASLLHDIGRILLLLAYPEQTSDYLQALQDQPERERMDVEQKIFATDHAETAAYLLHLWGFSYPVIEAVIFHHQPHTLLDMDYGPATALYVAEMLANGREVNGAIVDKFHLRATLASLQR